MKTFMAVSTACLALALGGCSEANRAIDEGQRAANKAVQNIDLPNVNWDKYPQQLHRKIDSLASKADCSGLRSMLDKRDGQDDGPVVQYIQTQLKKAGC